jgi:hypothetical protein
MFGELVNHVKQMRQLYTGTYQLFEWLRNNRKQSFFGIWNRSHNERHAARKRIHAFKLKGLKKYIEAIAKFNLEGSLCISPLLSIKHIKIKKTTWAKLLANKQYQKSAENMAEKHRVLGIKRRGFARLLKNRNYKEGKQQLEATLQLNRMKELLGNLAVELDEKKNTELAVLHIIKHGSINRMVRHIRNGLEEQDKVAIIEDRLCQHRKVYGLNFLVTNLSRDW